MRTQLLCTFAIRSRIEDITRIIMECNDILYNKIYVFEKVDTSDSWFPGIEVGGFNAYCLAYDLGKLSHLEEAGVDLQRI